MRKTEQEWIKDEFLYYLNPLKISILHKINLGQVFLGPEIVDDTGISYRILFSPAWTCKKKYSDALIILGIKENAIVSAAFTRLISSSLSNNYLESTGWIAVAESGIGLGTAIKNIRYKVLTSIANQMSSIIKHRVIDNNSTRIDSSEMGSEGRLSQRSKWEKLFSKTEMTFIPDKEPTKFSQISLQQLIEAGRNDDTDNIEELVRLLRGSHG